MYVLHTYLILIFFINKIKLLKVLNARLKLPGGVLMLSVSFLEKINKVGKLYVFILIISCIFS